MKIKAPSSELKAMCERLEDMAALFNKDTARLLDKARAHVANAMEDLESSGL